jgi:hypothetical protein
VRGWFAWHRAEREAVLNGPHAAMCERLFYIAKTLELKDATVLLAFVRGVTWTTIDPRTRDTVLHEIDTAITALRQRHGLAPFDDGAGLDERQSVLVICRNILFPREAETPTG